MDIDEILPNDIYKIIFTCFEIDQRATALFVCKKWKDWIWLSVERLVFPSADRPLAPHFVIHTSSEKYKYQIEHILDFPPLKYVNKKAIKVFHIDLIPYEEVRLLVAALASIESLEFHVSEDLRPGFSASYGAFNIRHLKKLKRLVFKSEIFFPIDSDWEGLEVFRWDYELFSRRRDIPLSYLSPTKFVSSTTLRKLKLVFPFKSVAAMVPKSVEDLEVLITTNQDALSFATVDLPNLRKLFFRSFSYQTQGYPVLYPPMPFLPKLEKLLIGSPFNVICPDFIANTPNLKKIVGLKAKSPSIPFLLKLLSLTKLSVSFSDISIKSLGDLSTLTNLNEVHLMGWADEDQLGDYARFLDRFLEKKPFLRRLEYTLSSGSNFVIPKSLFQTTQLVRLELGKVRFDDDVLISFSSMRNLERLTLFGSWVRVGHKGLLALTQIPNLSHLELRREVENHVSSSNVDLKGSLTPRSTVERFVRAAPWKETFRLVLVRLCDFEMYEWCDAFEKPEVLVDVHW